MSLEYDIRAVEGYFELGMYDDALRGIASLPEQHRQTPPLLSITGHSYLALKKWKNALAVFQQLIGIAPTNPDGYLHAAFSLHELGDTSQAKDILLSGATALKGNPVFYYNLACYECRLGNLDDAEELLEQAMSMEPRFKLSWLTDPDLQGLRERFLK